MVTPNCDNPLIAKAGLKYHPCGCDLGGCHANMLKQPEKDLGRKKSFFLSCALIALSQKASEEVPSLLKGPCQCQDVHSSCLLPAEAGLVGGAHRSGPGNVISAIAAVAPHLAVTKCSANQLS